MRRLTLRSGIQNYKDKMKITRCDPNNLSYFLLKIPGQSIVLCAHPRKVRLYARKKLFRGANALEKRVFLNFASKQSYESPPTSDGLRFRNKADASPYGFIPSNSSE